MMAVDASRFHDGLLAAGYNTLDQKIVYIQLLLVLLLLATS
jgi:hypothetical protein